MGIYALGVTPLLHFLHEFILINEHRSKEVSFADDLTVAEKIEEISNTGNYYSKWVQNTVII